MALLVWLLCMLVGGIPAALILTGCIWIVDNHAFKEYEGPNIFIKSYCLSLSTTFVYVGFAFIALVTGVLPIAFIGLILSLILWFVGLMNHKWGFGMSGWHAFVVSVFSVAISLGLQTMLGVGN